MASATTVSLRARRSSTEEQRRTDYGLFDARSRTRATHMPSEPVDQNRQIHRQRSAPALLGDRKRPSDAGARYWRRKRGSPCAQCSVSPRHSDSARRLRENGDVAVACSDRAFNAASDSPPAAMMSRWSRSSGPVRPGRSSTAARLSAAHSRRLRQNAQTPVRHRHRRRDFAFEPDLPGDNRRDDARRRHGNASRPACQCRAERQQETASSARNANR